MPGIENAEVEETEADLIEPTDDDLDLENLDEDMDFSLDFDEDGNLDGEKEDVEDKDKGTPDAGLAAKVESLEKKLEDSAAAIAAAEKRANSAAYVARKASEKKDTPSEDGSDDLTQAQVVGLMKEHGDDPQVMFNIMTHIAEQKAKGVATEAVDAGNTAKTKAQLDTYMDTEFPDYNVEGTETHKALSDVKGRLGLDKHPYGDFLAMATLSHSQTENIRKNSYDQGVKDALNKKVEKNRGKAIKANQPTPRGKKGTPSKAALSKAHKEVAAQLGLSDKQAKIYGRLLGNESNTVEVI